MEKSAHKTCSEPRANAQNTQGWSRGQIVRAALERRMKRKGNQSAQARTKPRASSARPQSLAKASAKSLSSSRCKSMSTSRKAGRAVPLDADHDSFRFAYHDFIFPL